MINSNELETLKDTLNYVAKFVGSSILIKIGGSILDDKALLQSFCQDILQLQAVGIQVILVHGGGKAISGALAKNQLGSEFVAGLRVTSQAAMTVIEKVLYEEVNQSIRHALQKAGVNAVSVSAVAHQILLCDYYSEQHGMVGQIKKTNPTAILDLLKDKPAKVAPIPVVTPLGVDEFGQALNVNADWSACALALALNVDKLIYLTDQEGVLDQAGNLISQLSMLDMEHLMNQGVAKGGMLTKLKTILAAMQGGLNHIHILNGRTSHALLAELFTAQGVGTLCFNQSMDVATMEHAYVNQA